MTPYQALAEDAARRVASLSPKQLEAIQLKARGFTQKECAAALGITKEAFADRSVRALQKLGVANAEEAIGTLYQSRIYRLMSAISDARDMLVKSVPMHGAIRVLDQAFEEQV